MNTLFRPRNFFSTGRRAADAPTFSLSRKALAVVLAWLMIPLGIGDLYAQDYPPPPPDQQYDQGPPPQQYNPLSFDQLDQLVAPIALYPDSLVAQILAASTYPQEVGQAEQMVEQNPGVPPQELSEMADEQNWDPSVKSLVAFPSVLANLSNNYDWASALGNAYYNQPQDVMTAIQTMRARAYEAGDLRSSQYLSVDYVPNAIVIAPANPEVFYVPWYNPWVVYGAPVPMWSGYYAPPRPVGFDIAVGVAIGFGLGIAMAHWNHYGWGCHHWGMGWRDRTVVYQRNVYISRSVVVVNHGYYGRYDRSVAARHYNENMARRAPTVFHPVAMSRGVANRGNNFHPTNTNRTTFNRNNNFNRTNNTRPQPVFNRGVANRGNNLHPTNTNRPTFNRNNTFNRTNNNRPQPVFNRTENRTQYNRPQQNVERPQQNFNRPEQNYNRPQPNFNRTENRTQYNRPQPNYERPQQTYNRPQPNYERPQQNYNRPQPNFERPQPNYERPQQNYNRPQQNFERPQENYNRPQQNFERPQQNYNRPQPNFERQQQNYSRPAPRQENQSRPNEDRGHGRR